MNPSPFSRNDPRIFDMRMPTPQQMQQIDHDARLYNSITDEIRHRGAYVNGRIRALWFVVSMLAIALAVQAFLIFQLWTH